MGNALMIDNWTLQDVEALMQNGIEPKDVSEIAISEDRQTHRFDPVPSGTIQIDALISLLTNIVCFDHLHVDSGFVEAWQRDGGFLAPLESLGVVQPDDYTALGQSLNDIREMILAELCVTESLRTAMQKIKLEWELTRSTSSPHLSALVWGGAGLLARSDLTSTPYFGHPFRRRLVAETQMFYHQANAVQQFEKFIETERAKMFRYRNERFGGAMAKVVLPPIPAYIIEESNSIHDLIPVAVQMRDKYAGLRQWLADYQRAIEEEDEGKQLRFEQTLTAVGKSIQVKYGAEKSGSLGISLSAAFFKADVSKKLVDGTLNRFGVRSTLAKLIMAPRGQQALAKLVGMLGESKSSLGRTVLLSCQKRFS